MCTNAELWSTLLLVALAAAAAVSAILQHRFLSQLEDQHPSVWKQLGKRKVLTDDGTTSYAAAQWYLLEAEFTTLENLSLVALGRKARTSFFAAAAIFIAWGVVAVSANASPRLTCILSLLQTAAPRS